jgi:small subunit ribosomal protein S9
MAAFPQQGTRGTGRRKEAVARVRLVKGTGKFLVNNQTVHEYFGLRRALVLHAEQPLVSVGLRDKYDVLVKAHGGGKAGQAGAIRLGIARALLELAPDQTKALRDEGYLTRDPRVKERKKYGLHKARKRPQYSKR